MITLIVLIAALVVIGTVLGAALLILIGILRRW